MSEHFELEIADLVAGRLPEERVRAVEEHVRTCERCAAELEWAERLRDDALREGLRHLSAMHIVRLAAGERTTSDVEAQHLEECDACRAELDWARRPPAIDEARSRSWSAWGWLAAAAALVLVVYLLLPGRGTSDVSALATIEPLPVQITRDVPGPGTFEESRLNGLDAYASGDWAAARASLAAAARLKPGDGEILLYLGSAALLDGDRGAARDALDRAVREAGPDRVRDEAVWQLANLALLENRRSEAERLLERLAAGDHRAQDAAALLGRLREAAESRSGAASLRQEHRRLYREGRVLPARATAEKELAILRARAEPGGTELAQSLHDLGVDAAEAGDYDRARALLEEALAVRRERLGDSDPAVAETLLAQIPVLLFTMRGEDALERAGRALEIVRRAHGEEHPAFARALTAVAATHRALGGRDASHYELADRKLRQALGTQLRELGPEHSDIAETLLALGENEMAMDNLERAEQLLGRAVEMRRRLHGPEHPAVADALYWHGRSFAALGETSRSIERFQEELSIRTRLFRRHHKTIRCRVSLAHAYRSLERFAEARELAATNIEDHEELYGRDSGWCMLTLNLALLQIQLDEFEAAETRIATVERRIDDLAEDGVETAYLVRTVGHRRIALTLRAGRYAEAEQLSRRKLRRLRDVVGGGSRWTVRAREFLAQALAGKGDLSGAEQELSAAVREFEQARTKAGPGTRAATFESTPYEQRAVVRLELGDTAGAWRDLERARGRVLSDALLEGAVPLELERVQASLGHGTAIVGWLDREIVPGETRSWAYVLRRERPVRWERLPAKPGRSASGPSEDMSAFRQELLRAARTSLGPDRFSTSSAQAVWRARLEPIEHHLLGVDTLLVVPSGPMADLPLDALMDGSGRFVGDRFAVVHVPSAALHAWLAEKPSRAERREPAVLALGDPPFREEHLAPWTPAASSSSAADDGSYLRGAVRGDRAALARLPRLPWSRREAESLARMFPDSTLLVGSDASAVTLRRAAARGELIRFDVVHLATHALIDPGQPGRSALVLSQVGETEATEEGEPDPGIITAAEIGRDWRLDARLVTLSACETARGRPVYGEGTVGFSYPLFEAGARSMLVSLWPVNDRATALLMERFYSNWLGSGGDTGKARALMEAKRWLREWRDEAGETPYSHPYFWAAFILVGDGEAGAPG